ncbi:AAA family ATPase [Acetobacter sp. DmW_136]|uniref:ATP-binding protein n=1 Tax=Acetobacteraceae TaxID=433 RepID=UPI00113E10E8|nr:MULTISPECIES: ATP-binding protein [Acetobacteraceae]KAA8386503.1 AAA family ATPase [Acetobacter sp. DmW_136]GCE90267.1 adenylate kinase [Komagataeibacter diospyri]
MKKRIMVFGVSGIGKTTACKAYVSKNPMAIYLSMGTLMQEIKQDTGERLRLRGVDKIKADQHLLGEVLDKKLSVGSFEVALLDAHSVIDNGHELVTVPVEAVALLQPNAIISLTASASDVLARRTGDTRVRPLRKVEDIEKQIKESNHMAKSYSERLSLPFEEASVTESFDLTPLIKKILSRIG